MELGIALPSSGASASPEDIARVARDAERIGLGAVWTFERWLRPAEPNMLGVGPMPLPDNNAIVYDPLETLSYVAAITSRIRLGTSVLDTLFHSPVVLARRLATLDRLKGRAMIDRELYLPKSWTEDPARCRAARVPEEVGFRTKPQLARVMLERALDAGVPAAWVTADEAYGGNPALRGWLEGRGVWHVLAVKCTELLGADSPKGPLRQSAEQLAAAVPAEQWIACSAGHGAKGRRLYDWTRVELAAPATTGMARWLLVRRSRSDGELAFYACYGPATTPLVGLVRVAGIRWAVEEGFEQAKGEVGLDHYEVRKWPGWYRHVTLALLAHAFLAVTRAQATSPKRTKGAAAA